ncbi:Ferredoxin--NAD(P)(+) reductase (naphthalene dioxygenase ferredoxin-specific) [Roseivivax sp. THAF40]|uniref:FAD-binding oxidoreductase n=1 Tax=unclassified Roseivivax TaxID=2639302 RepID=UPI00126946F6|nr:MULTISPECIES: FAD-binding oxidoreductase [unclassified Roseivivax]QFS81675.1 Ferredoxin--NAD(P)(+) reductase (naphthalene dioxygenase ferredoxin-specific) [Roseivivax sp. THAF197b]QFT45467.1 Ferredoxin--NAD(P)(+) reductase (naphthalene dioxygenase ferredoxin-specific) [Roseivivax sp. THAF40]
MSHTLTLKSIEPVTHDTHHLVFDRPEGFEFEPGQAVDLALDRDGWREEKRPFTFTSLPQDDTLEFVIKSYPDHDGVTEQIGQLKAGDRVIIDDPWGAISDKGAGWFIAGGAGVTPFIAILKKRLKENGTLEGSTLIFSNKTEADIILRDTFESMSGLKCVFTVTDEPDSPLCMGMIGKEMLAEHVSPGEGPCYICGPDPMIDAVADALKEIGVAEEHIITEEFD